MASRIIGRSWRPLSLAFVVRRGFPWLPLSLAFMVQLFTWIRRGFLAARAIGLCGPTVSLDSHWLAMAFRVNGLCGSAFALDPPWLPMVARVRGLCGPVFFFPGSAVASHGLPRHWLSWFRFLFVLDPPWLSGNGFPRQWPVFSGPVFSLGSAVAFHGFPRMASRVSGLGGHAFLPWIRS